MANSLHVFVFADALGWKLCQRHSVFADWPVRNPCQTVFGYSSTCDPTILTGCTPREHGHFSFFIKATPQFPSPFAAFRHFGWLPNRIAGYHRLRNVLSRHFARANGFTGYFQLYSVPFSRLPFLAYSEQRDIYEPGGIIGGQPTIFAKWDALNVPWHRSDWRQSDVTNFHDAAAQLQSGQPRLLYLFTAGLDAVMHRFGPDAPEAAAAIRAFEAQLRGLLDAAKRHYSHVDCAVFSDHGMTAVSKTSDLRRRFERLPFRFGKDYVAVWDSTMARFWFDNPAAPAARSIREWLAAQPDGAIVSPQQLADWHCDFPDQRYGQLFFLLPPGSLFVPSFLNLSSVPGMHGYHPDHPDSTAAWLATSTALPPVHQLADIHNAMLHAAHMLA